VEKSHKFVVLDTFRGVAAIIVMAYHIGLLFDRHVFSHGYLAVDFFFMLSGFVLTHSYQHRLDQGWAMAPFLKTRLARLYPLYFAGMVLSLLLFLARMVAHSPQAANGQGYFWLFLLGILFLPSPVHVAGFAPFIFPLNSPAWSLFYEVIVNALHAAFGRRRSRFFLGAVTGLSGIMMAFMILHHGSLDAGETPAEAGYALVRVVFAYTFGSLLCRTWHAGLIRLPNLPFLATLLLVTCLAIPLSWHKALVDLVSALLIFPCVLLLGAAAKPSRWMVQPSLILGRASYGIYVLHVPLVLLGQQIWFRLGRHPIEQDSPWSGLALIAASLILVLILDSIYDAPARRWLAHKLHLTRAQTDARVTTTV
jgi:peptidoglycan/LPS O-acetylase OafA/YrhL